MQVRDLVPLAPATDGRPPLVCLPPAGAGPTWFLPLVRQLPAGAGAYGLQLPGHGARVREQPLTAMSEVLAGMATALDRLAEPRYVLLGHSMGGLLAFEFARRCGGTAAPRPVLLVVSGCQAPRLREKLPIRHTLPDDALVAAMVELGAPPEPFEINEIRRLALPVLRADLQLTEAWRYVPAAPLDIPILALAGADDPDAPPADMGDWSSATTSWFDLVEYDGGHFFPQGRGRELAEVIQAARDRLDAG